MHFAITFIIAFFVGFFCGIILIALGVISKESGYRERITFLEHEIKELKEAADKERIG